MTRISLISIAACAHMLSALPVGAEDKCGVMRGGQYAEQQHCVNVLTYPNGKPAPAAMLDSVPETYPWLFRFDPGGPAPQQTIKVKGAVDGFSTLQIINGWANYDTSGAENSQFQKFSRVKDILIETGSGHSVTHTLKDTEEMQFVTLPEPLAKDSVSVKVLSVYPGGSETVALRWFSIAWEDGL
jgi:hypothetical protein